MPGFPTKNVALILKSVDNFRKFSSGKRGPLVSLLFQENKENLHLSHSLISFQTGFENISINILTFSRNWSWEINSLIHNVRKTQLKIKAVTLSYIYILSSCHRLVCLRF